MGEVIFLDILTRLDIPVDRVLDAAKESGLESVIVVGRDGNGEFYLASSKANVVEVLWDLEVAKHKIIGIGEGLNDD